jgi:RimJ/RimL family protein N-acetyltransferase
MKLQTKHLELIACNREILAEALKSNEHLGDYLNIEVPENWSEFGNSALNYALAQINAGDSQVGWWTYLPIHKADNKLIGSCGFRGQPDENGAVEIGYEIKADYRNKGLATELSQALIQHAFQNPEVNKVQAHTLGEVNPSTRVLSKCGFIKTEEIQDPDNGTLWKWELKRP